MITEQEVESWTKVSRKVKENFGHSPMIVNSKKAVKRSVRSPTRTSVALVTSESEAQPLPLCSAFVNSDFFVYRHVCISRVVRQAAVVRSTAVLRQYSAD